MRPLHYGADCDSERLSAVLAVVYAGPRGLARYLRDPIAGHAAARAVRTLRPEDRFQIFASCIVIVEDRVAEIDFFSCHCRNL